MQRLQKEVCERNECPSYSKMAVQRLGVDVCLGPHGMSYLFSYFRPSRSWQNKNSIIRRRSGYSKPMTINKKEIQFSLFNIMLI